MYKGVNKRCFSQLFNIPSRLFQNHFCKECVQCITLINKETIATLRYTLKLLRIIKVELLIWPLK